MRNNQILQRSATANSRALKMQAWGDPPPPGRSLTLPDNLPSVVQLRQLHGLPPLQSAIMFLNGSRTMCYANGGTNAILAPISINEFLGQLPPTEIGLVKRLRLLSLTPPGQELLKANNTTNMTKSIYSQGASMQSATGWSKMFQRA